MWQFINYFNNSPKRFLTLTSVGNFLVVTPHFKVFYKYFNNVKYAYLQNILKKWEWNLEFSIIYWLNIHNGYVKIKTFKKVLDLYPKFKSRLVKSVLLVLKLIRNELKLLDETINAEFIGQLRDLLLQVQHANLLKRHWNLDDPGKTNSFVTSLDSKGSISYWNGRVNRHNCY